MIKRNLHEYKCSRNRRKEKKYVDQYNYVPIFSIATNSNVTFKSILFSIKFLLLPYANKPWNYLDELLMLDFFNRLFFLYQFFYISLEIINFILVSFLYVSFLYVSFLSVSVIVGFNQSINEAFKFQSSRFYRAMN